MVYRAIGAVCGHEGMTIAFAEFHENAGAWNYEIKTNNIYPFENTGQLINQFINGNNLQYQVALISVFSHSSAFSLDGAVMAAETGLPVITDLPAMDRALGGNGEFLSTAAAKLNMSIQTMSKTDKAACVAFMGVLRWREEYNFLSSITGASRSSIGGALWLGQEA